METFIKEALGAAGRSVFGSVGRQEERTLSFSGQNSQRAR